MKIQNIRKKMNRSKLTYIALISLMSCTISSCAKEHKKDTQTNIKKTIIEEVDTLKKAEKFIHFPIPQLDSIFPFFETSGVAENSPSEIFYNPTDSGLFVFYTLFDKKMPYSKYSFDKAHIGTLTTHTYWKPNYGWSEMDKDQTFIHLQLDEDVIQVGKFIKVGSTFKELQKELGQPIYKIDSLFVFLGKNKIIGQFQFENGLLKSLTYGRYNLPNKIFDVDSIERKKMIEELIN